LAGNDLAGWKLQWNSSQSLRLARMESAEFFVSTPPTREEFRAACDKARTPAEVVSLLSLRES